MLDGFEAGTAYEMVACLREQIDHLTVEYGRLTLAMGQTKHRTQPTPTRR